MPTIAKTATLGALGLPAGDHLVRFHIEADVISFEIADSQPLAGAPASTAHRQPTGFLKKWGSTARKIEDPADAWLTHINEKHVR